MENSRRARPVGSRPQILARFWIEVAEFECPPRHASERIGIGRQRFGLLLQFPPAAVRASKSARHEPGAW